MLNITRQWGSSLASRGGSVWAERWSVDGSRWMRRGSAEFQAEVCPTLRRLGRARFCSFTRQRPLLVAVDPLPTQAEHGVNPHFTAKMGRARVWTPGLSDFHIHTLSMITIFFFFFPFCHTLWGMWNFPDQGSNLCPLHWKQGVLTTRPPGKFSMITILRKVYQHRVTWGNSSSLSTIRILAKIVNTPQYKSQ